MEGRKTPALYWKDFLLLSVRCRVEYDLYHVGRSSHKWYKPCQAQAKSRWWSVSKASYCRNNRGSILLGGGSWQCALGLFRCFFFGINRGFYSSRCTFNDRFEGLGHDRRCRHRGQWGYINCWGGFCWLRSLHWFHSLILYILFVFLQGLLWLFSHRFLRLWS